MIAAALVAAVVVAGGLAAWNWWFREGSQAAASEQIVEATLGTVTDSIETSGTVASQDEISLSFSAAGDVEAVNATLGQKVKAGDVLATLDAPELEDSVRRAEISLISAQLQLNELLEGSDAAQLANAEESYQRALAAQETALRALDDVRAGPAQADLATAQQKVLDAEAALAQAQVSREALDSRSSDAAAAADTALDKAQSALDQAEAGEDDAADALDVAAAQLQGAEAGYCPDGDVSFCGSPSVPLSSADRSALQDVVASFGAKASLASDVLDASTAYQQRLTAKSSASSAVDDAEEAVDDAQAALDDAQEGPSSADIKSADANVSSAQLARQQALDDLLDVQDGASTDELRAAELDVTSAEAALLSADASRDEAYAGADARELTNQRNQVELAQMSLDDAKRGLEDAQLIAPFDGTVAELDIAVGDEVGGGAGTDTGTGAGTDSNTAAIVLNTPDALRIELAINEEDLSSIEVGQTGTATFDQLDGAVYSITIDEIGSSPTTTQGVVTYDAVASVDLTRRVVAAPQGFPGGNGAMGDRASAFATAQAGGQIPDDVATTIAGRSGAAPGVDVPSSPPAGGTGVQGTESTAKPAPGMSATIAITIDEASDVIVVPSGAIKNQGPQQYVEIVGDGGQRSQANVETGLSDGSQTAVISGLEAGQQVVVPAAAATTSALPTGGFPGGGFPGGGGGGGFGGGGTGGGGGGGQ